MNLHTDYGCPMKPFFIEISNFWAWVEYVMKRLILALIWHTLRIEFSNENIKFCSQCRLPLSFKSPMHMICSIVYFSLIFCWFFSFSLLRNRYIWWFSKPSLKIRTANAICWIYLGVFRDYGLDNIF